MNCVPISLDRYHRTFATCSVDHVGEWLVRQGLALNWSPAGGRASGPWHLEESIVEGLEAFIDIRPIPEVLEPCPSIGLAKGRHHSVTSA
jgi:hypothetical protein